MPGRSSIDRGTAPEERLDEEMIAVLRDKTPAERLAMADGVWRSARSMIEDVLRAEDADRSRDRVRREAARRLAHGAF